MSYIHDAQKHAAQIGARLSMDSAIPVFTPAVLLSIARRHRKLFSTVFGIFFLTAALIVLVMPKKYEAEMKLLVKNERQDLVVSPENNVNTVHPGETSETQINSEIELIRSADVLREVALGTGLSKPEAGAVLAAGGISPFSLEKALKGLSHDLSISAVKKSSIIDITYTAKNPEQASNVLQHLADSFLVAHLKVHANPGTFAFFDQQARTYQTALTLSEVQLRKFRESHSAFGLPDQNDILATRSMEAQSSLEETETQIADYKQRIAQSRKALKALSARITTQTRTVPQSQLIESLSQSLLQLQNRRTELVAKFKVGDRLVTEVDKEIADTSEALKLARAQNAEENTSDTNPVRQNVEKAMVVDQVALSGLEARRKALNTVVRNYKQKMFSLAESTVQHESLIRRVKENEANYLLYQKKREEARIAESLDKDRITNVAVIQAPVTPVQPSGPRVKLDLVLSAICALFFASVAVLLAEFLLPRPTVKQAVAAAN